MRFLSDTALAALDSGVLSPALFVEIEVDPVQRFWTGHGGWLFDPDRPEDGRNQREFTGAADMLQIGDVVESEDGRATGITLKLANIPLEEKLAETLAALRAQHYQAKPGSCWLAFFDPNRLTEMLAIIPVFRGLIDDIKVEISPSTGGTVQTSFSVKLESPMINLRRATQRRYTNEDQKHEFPGDASLRFVPFLQERKILWGKEGAFFQT